MSQNIVAIIQARMTSTRLPGKVLMDVVGSPMLLHQVKRLEKCLTVNNIIIATTDKETDDPVEDLAKRNNIYCFRGSEFDVLGRFVSASLLIKADVIIRLTADCPLIDPDITDNVITELIDHSNVCDYASNVMNRTYPRGLDVEAFFSDTLYRLDRLAQTSVDREHVTTLIRSGKPNLFSVRSIEDSQDNSDLRWTVDTASDLDMIRSIFADLNLSEHCLPYQDILSFVRNQPQLSKLNSEIKTWDPIHRNP